MAVQINHCWCTRHNMAALVGHSNKCIHYHRPPQYVLPAGRPTPPLLHTATHTTHLVERRVLRRNERVLQLSPVRLRSQLEEPLGVEGGLGVQVSGCYASPGGAQMCAGEAI
jgi:hypothetical protein